MELDIREVADGAVCARALFRYRYAQDPPEFPYHVVAFHRRENAVEVPVCYVHFTALDEILLGGGACVDNRVMRKMAPATRKAIRKRGGLYRMTLDWAIHHFALKYSAIFGYCGDVLAERIDLAAGFEHTPHKKLLAYWTRKLPGTERDRLIAQAHAIGPF